MRPVGLEARTVQFRHDLFYPTMPAASQATPAIKQAHWWFSALGQAPQRPIVLDTQGQSAQFLASGGTVIAPMANPRLI